MDVQVALGEEAEAVMASAPWTLPSPAVVSGCFVAYATGEAGPGRAGDRAWAAAVAWSPAGVAARSADRVLRRRGGFGGPRQASDVVAQVVVEQQVPAPYVPGLLARREGPILAAAVADLEVVADVLLVDATGLDHPRRAGLAVHLGRVTGMPTVGVTRRPLLARGEQPPLVRGASTPVAVDDRVVGRWVCTRTDALPSSPTPGGELTLMSPPPSCWPRPPRALAPLSHCRKPAGSPGRRARSPKQYGRELRARRGPGRARLSRALSRARRPRRRG